MPASTAKTKIEEKYRRVGGRVPVALKPVLPCAIAGARDDGWTGAMADRGGLLAGKRGLIMGVANNRSIAWGIARACRQQGAEIALTHQGDALKKRVEPLAAEIGAHIAGHCDVADEATIDAVFDDVAS